AQGFVAHQPGVIIDTTTGAAAEVEGRRVPRYRCTARGRRLAAAAAEDPRVLEETFPRIASHNIYGVLDLLHLFALDGAEAKAGLSTRLVVTRTGMAERTVKWWIRRLIRDRYLVELPNLVADIREVVPEH